MVLDNYTEFEWYDFSGVATVGYLSDEDLCYLNWDNGKEGLNDD